MALSSQVKEDGTVAVDTSGVESSEYAALRRANIISIIGMAIGAIIAIGPDIIKILPDGSQAAHYIGGAIVIASKLSAMFNTMNYNNGRVATKAALIQGAVDTAKAQNPPTPATANTNVLSGGTVITTSPIDPKNTTTKIEGLST